MNMWQENWANYACDTILKSNMNDSLNSFVENKDPFWLLHRLETERRDVHGNWDVVVEALQREMSNRSYSISEARDCLTRAFVRKDRQIESYYQCSIHFQEQKMKALNASILQIRDFRSSGTTKSVPVSVTPATIYMETEKNYRFDLDFD